MISVQDGQMFYLILISVEHFFFANVDLIGKFGIASLYMLLIPGDAEPRSIWQVVRMPNGLF